MSYGIKKLIYGESGILEDNRSDFGRLYKEIAADAGIKALLEDKANVNEMKEFFRLHFSSQGAKAAVRGIDDCLRFVSIMHDAGSMKDLEYAEGKDNLESIEKLEASLAKMFDPVQGKRYYELNSLYALLNCETEHSYEDTEAMINFKKLCDGITNSLHYISYKKQLSKAEQLGSLSRQYTLMLRDNYEDRIKLEKKLKKEKLDFNNFNAKYRELNNEIFYLQNSIVKRIGKIKDKQMFLEPLVKNLVDENENNKTVLKGELGVFDDALDLWKSKEKTLSIFEKEIGEFNSYIKSSKELVSDIEEEIKSLDEENVQNSKIVKLLKEEPSFGKVDKVTKQLDILLTMQANLSKGYSKESVFSKALDLTNLIPKGANCFYINNEDDIITSEYALKIDELPAFKKIEKGMDVSYQDMENSIEEAIKKCNAEMGKIADAKEKKTYMIISERIKEFKFTPQKYYETIRAKERNEEFLEKTNKNIEKTEKNLGVKLDELKNYLNSIDDIDKEYRQKMETPIHMVNRIDDIMKKIGVPQNLSISDISVSYGNIYKGEGLTDYCRKKIELITEGRNKANNMLEVLNADFVTKVTSEYDTDRHISDDLLKKDVEMCNNLIKKGEGYSKLAKEVTAFKDDYYLVINNREELLKAGYKYTATPAKEIKKLFMGVENTLKYNADPKHANTGEFSKMYGELINLLNIEDNVDTDSLEFITTQLKKSATEYIEAKNSQFRPFPSGLRTSRLEAANQIVKLCDMTIARNKAFDKFLKANPEVNNLISDGVNESYEEYKRKKSRYSSDPYADIEDLSYAESEFSERKADNRVANYLEKLDFDSLSNSVEKVSFSRNEGTKSISKDKNLSEN